MAVLIITCYNSIGSYILAQSYITCQVCFGSYIGFLKVVYYQNHVMLSPSASSGSTPRSTLHDLPSKSRTVPVSLPQRARPVSRVHLPLRAVPGRALPRGD